MIVNNMDKENKDGWNWIKTFFNKIRNSKLYPKVARIANIIKYIIITAGSMFLGFNFFAIYSKYIGNDIPDWKTVLAIYGSFITLLTAIFVIIEKFFQLEIQDMQLKLYNEDLNNKKENNDIPNKRKLDEILYRLATNSERGSFPYDSIYEERAMHYANEKTYIAKYYVNLLKDRIQYINKNKDNKIDRIIIVLDSGTTITPIFDLLGNQASKDPEHWLRLTNLKNREKYSKFQFPDIDVYTNNLRGVQQLFKYRSTSSGNNKDRHAEIPFVCNILPGKILSAYEAIADQKTIYSLLDLKKIENSYIICIVTGNYILYHDNVNDKQCIPIARTGFHPHVKAALYSIADEIHLIAPLGKVLKGNDIKKTENLENLLIQFNIDLNFNNSSSSEENKSYSLVNPNLLTEMLEKSELCDSDYYINILQNQNINSWTKKSILVTTSRTSNFNFLLYDHSINLKRLDKFIPSDIDNTQRDIATDLYPKKGPYIVAEDFSDIRATIGPQLEDEIPHDNLRKFDLIKKYFDVNNSILKIKDALDPHKWS